MGKRGNSESIDSKDIQTLHKVVGSDSIHKLGKQMESEFLTPYDLYRRWSRAISTKTLANWRSLKVGPPYSKFRGRVVYRASDVLSWENQNRFGTRM